MRIMYLLEEYIENGGVLIKLFEDDWLFIDRK